MTLRISFICLLFISSLGCSKAQEGAVLAKRNTGFGTNTFVASNGKSGEFKVQIPDDIAPGKSYGLLIYLHGDGAEDYKWFFENLATVAAKYSLIPVMVLSPTTNTDGRTWWVDADANAAFLDELLHKELLDKYSIDKTRVVFTGISGGPTFLTGPWLRYYASEYRGGAVLFCGGFNNTDLPFRDSPGFKSSFPLYFYVGTKDYLLPGTKDAIKYYQDQGMQVAAEFPEGIGHCDFYDYMDRLLDERIAKIFPH